MAQGAGCTAKLMHEPEEGHVQASWSLLGSGSAGFRRAPSTPGRKAHCTCTACSTVWLVPDTCFLVQPADSPQESPRAPAGLPPLCHSLVGTLGAPAACPLELPQAPLPLAACVLSSHCEKSCPGRVPQHRLSFLQFLFSVLFCFCLRTKSLSMAPKT